MFIFIEHPLRKIKLLDFYGQTRWEKKYVWFPLKKKQHWWRNRRTLFARFSCPSHHCVVRSTLTNKTSLKHFTTDHNNNKEPTFHTHILDKTVVRAIMTILQTQNKQTFKMRAINRETIKNWHNFLMKNVSAND